MQGGPIWKKRRKERAGKQARLFRDTKTLKQMPVRGIEDINKEPIK